MRLEQVRSRSKGGIKMLTKALAFELAPYGIRVNGINPGPVETKFASDLHDSPGVMVIVIPVLPTAAITWGYR